MPFYESGQLMLSFFSVSCLRRASSYEDEYMIVGDDGEDDSRPLFQENPTGLLQKSNISHVYSYFF